MFCLYIKRLPSIIFILKNLDLHRHILHKRVFEYEFYKYKKFIFREFYYLVTYIEFELINTQ